MVSFCFIYFFVQIQCQHRLTLFCLGWEIDYSQVTDWPKDYVPPRDAKTADKVFPQEYGVNAKRVLARTNTEKCAQEAAMVMKILAEVEKYNSTIPVENRLSCLSIKSALYFIK